MRPIASYYRKCLATAKKLFESKIESNDNPDAYHAAIDAIDHLEMRIASDIPDVTPWASYDDDDITEPIDDRHDKLLTPRELTEAIIGAKEVKVGMTVVESDSVVLLDYSVSDKAIVLKYTTTDGRNVVAEIDATKLVATAASNTNRVVVSDGTYIWGSKEDVVLVLWFYALAPKTVWSRPPCPPKRAASGSMR